MRTPLLAAMTGFTVVVAGHLQHLARDAFALGGSHWLAAAARLVGTLVPDLQVFNALDRFPRGEPISTEVVVIVAVYALGYLGAYGALATASFARRAL